jgi:hypothetical protein
MARIEWVCDRLRNWQRYMLLREGGAGFAGPSYGERVDGDGWDAPTVITINDDEARKTGEAVDRLPGDLLATVRVKYLGVLVPGNRKERVAVTETQQLQRLCIHRATMHARLERADRLLANEFDTKRLLAEAERKRVERVIEAIRPN